MYIPCDILQLTSLTCFVQYYPIISPNEFQYVHHMLIYLCDNLEATDVGASAPCGGAVGATVSQCLSGELIAAWAVGGNVRPYDMLCAVIFHANYNTVELLCYGHLWDHMKCPD